MFHATLLRRLAALLLLALALSACGTDDPEQATNVAPWSPGDIATIVDDLNDYWSVADADLGFEYEPVDSDRVGTGADRIVCNNKPIEASEVEDNAFVDASCAEGITVAFDPAYVGASLARAEATMAHEWGHVIQFQASELDLSQDPNGLPIDGELQADCFAGAWAAERAAADIERLRIDTAKAGDDDDIAIDDPHAHGSAEERTTAFDVGLDGGPAACINELIDALPGG